MKYVYEFIGTFFLVFDRSLCGISARYAAGRFCPD